MKKIISLVIAIVILYTILRIVSYLGYHDKGCYLHRDVYIQTIKSRILQKYVDSKNHNDKVIIYSGKNHEQELMVFTSEFRDMFGSIDVGDSIIKNANSINYRVIFKATGKDTVFKYQTTCEDSIKKTRK